MYLCTYVIKYLTSAYLYILSLYVFKHMYILFNMFMIVYTYQYMNVWKSENILYYINWFG